LQKKIEKNFAEKHPNLWVPTYSRVTFSERSYSEALAIGDAQEEIMKEIMKLPNIEEIWDSDTIEAKILTLLKEKPPIL
jgi:kynurenine 3-monooxygenase